MNAKPVQSIRADAESGNPRAQYALAKDILDGKVPAKTAGEGIEWLRRASAQGHLRSQTWLARIFLVGRGAHRSICAKAISGSGAPRGVR